MFYILNIKLENNLKEWDILTLKEKQSLVNYIINLFSNYGKSIHDNRLKKGWSFHLVEKWDSLKININSDRYIWLNITKHLENIKGKDFNIWKYQFKVVSYENFLMKDGFLNDKDVFRSLSPLYINETIWEWIVKNYNINYSSENAREIKNKILENLNNYCWTQLVLDKDIKILVYKNMRHKTGFTEKWVWNLFRVDFIFLTSGSNNIDDINKAKTILSTGFYKSTYWVWHFVFDKK